MTHDGVVSGSGFVGKLLEQLHGEDLREILSSALKAVMEAEVSALCKASYGERSEEREHSRNGYRDREFSTRLGDVQLRLPKLRTGTYAPSFLEPRRRWEQAFMSVVTEAYVQGVSTRRVAALVEAMGATGMSKSEVSRMAASLDAEVREFRERRLDKAYPYVWLDALYIKVRRGQRIVSTAILLATGVNADGEREVLGVDSAASEQCLSWKGFLSSLLERGLRGVQLAISDGHEGLKQAIAEVFAPSILPVTCSLPFPSSSSLRHSLPYARCYMLRARRQHNGLCRRPVLCCKP